MKQQETMSHTSNGTIKVVIYKTTLPGVFSILLKSKTPKVGKTKDSIIIADKSGSMLSTMTGGLTYLNFSSLPPTTGPISAFSQFEEEDEENGNLFSTFATPMAAPSSQVPLSFSTSRVSSSPVDDEETRIGCVNGFLQRNIDFFSYMRDSLSLDNNLTIILFDHECEIFSTHDGISLYQMKNKVRSALDSNGGTDFSSPLEKMEEYKQKSTNDVDTIFISDGEHSGEESKQKICLKYAKKVDLTVGIGECDRQTLSCIGKEFMETTSARRLRDTICFRTTETVTNIAQDLQLDSTGIGYSNMKKNEDTYSWPDMSLLLELYAVAQTGTVFTLKYKTGESEHTISILLTEEAISSYQGDDIEYNLDTGLGDKIAFTMESHHEFNKIIKKFKVNNNVEEKQTLVMKFKAELESSSHLYTYKGSKIDIYLQQIIGQVHKIALTKEDSALMELAANFNSDVLQSAGVISSSGLASSSSSPQCDGASTMCPICETNHRSVVYDPCGHFVCSSCAGILAEKKKDCPFCRNPVRGCIIINLPEDQKKEDSKLICPTCNVREIGIVSYNCKHAFSCMRCATKQKAKNGKITCFCGKECKKFVNIYG